jgi:hypothetical protein
MLAIVWVSRWRKQPGTSPWSLEEVLSHFRGLERRGELSAEEFARIRGLLEQQARHERQWPKADSTAPSQPSEAVRPAPPPP